MLVVVVIYVLVVLVVIFLGGGGGGFGSDHLRQGDTVFAGVGFFVCLSVNIFAQKKL